ncbi:FAD-dependent oxidoreductase [Curtobacterium flaccumfaciens]|nr:FAD-dependent oxidoreductase [Curtobacterium flaccumfaciens]
MSPSSTRTRSSGADVPADLAQAFQQRFVDHGVGLRLGRRVESGSESADGVTLTLDDGSTVEADAVVVGLGIEPRTQLAADAGLTVRDGIVVSSTLLTDDDSVFAAGDVAEYPDRILGTRRVEHVDNAQQQGRQAGRNLADADETYDHTPMFYSDVFDTGYEAVGQVSTGLRTVEDWQEPTVTGVVYYLDQDDVTRGSCSGTCGTRPTRPGRSSPRRTRSRPTCCRAASRPEVRTALKFDRR